jgi:hypothetical protein
MGTEVYANGNAIACKAGDAKVIAAFPDVCLSPPSPPAGPVPIPYPDTSFSKDMQNGSTTVKIKGKEVMLKDKSFYKTSPLGDEAATRSFGANVITHVITGKTFFKSWSLDVKFEGENVDRHLDLTTSNHASDPFGEGALGPDTEGVAPSPEEKKVLCECCGDEAHSASQNKGNSLTEDEYFNPKPPGKEQRPAWSVDAEKLFSEIRSGPCADMLHKKPAGDEPCAKHYVTSAKETARSRNTFNDEMRPTFPKTVDVDHKTPLSGGGCPKGGGNLSVPSKECQENYKDKLAGVQQRAAQWHRRVAGI